MATCAECKNCFDCQGGIAGFEPGPKTKDGRGTHLTQYQEGRFKGGPGPGVSAIEQYDQGVGHQFGAPQREPPLQRDLHGHPVGRN